MDDDRLPHQQSTFLQDAELVERRGIRALGKMQEPAIQFTARISIRDVRTDVFLFEFSHLGVHLVAPEVVVLDVARQDPRERLVVVRWTTLHGGRAAGDLLHLGILDRRFLEIPVGAALDEALRPGDRRLVAGVVLPLVAVGVETTLQFVIPQWQHVVVNVIVHVDESRVDRPAGVNHIHAPDVRPWGLSILPHRLNDTILDEHIAPVEHRILRVHGYHPALEDVLAIVDVVAHCVAGALRVVRADVGSVVGGAGCG